MRTEQKSQLVLCALLYVGLFGLLLSPGRPLSALLEQGSITAAVEEPVACDMLCRKINGFFNGMAAYCPDTLSGIIKTADTLFPFASAYLEPWTTLSTTGDRYFRYRPPPKPLVCYGSSLNFWNRSSSR